jgi:hypothetical protein
MVIATRGEPHIHQHVLTQPAPLMTLIDDKSASIAAGTDSAGVALTILDERQRTVLSGADHDDFLAAISRSF